MDQRTTTSAATTLLAIVGCGAAFTWLGPVLRPFLVAVFVFYAVQSAAKGLARLGLGLTAAYITLISGAGIIAILLGQLVYRESGVFLGKWPKYEQRIEFLLDTWPLLGGIRPPAPAADEETGARPTAERRTSEPSTPGDDKQAPAKRAGSAADLEPTAATPAPETPADADRVAGAPADGEPAADPPDGDTAAAAPAAEAAAAGPPAPAAEAGPESAPKTGASPPRPRSLLKDFVAGGAKELIDYVFRHSLDMAELLILVIVYTIFLSLGRRQLQARVERAFPGERGRRLLAIGAGIGRSMETFMTVKTLVGAGMAASAAGVMLWFRVDHWLLWTCLFFAANYVTYIGSMAACVPPIVIALLDLPNPATACLVAVLLIVNRLVWIDFVEVRMAGRELSLDPVIVFLWLAYWGWVWGVLGLLLAYPMLATVKIVLSQVEGWEGWAVLLGDR